MPPTPKRSPAKRRLLLRLVQLLLLAVVLVFVGRSLYRGFVKVDWSVPINWGMVALAFGVMFVHMFLVASAVRATLASVCKMPGWTVMLAVTWLSRIGKYIPGKVASVAGMAYLLQSRGVDGAIAASMVLVNTCLVVLIGLVVSAPLLLWQPLAEAMPLAWLWALLLMAAGLLVIHPRILFPLVNCLLAKLKRPALTVKPRLGGYLWPSVQILGQWVFAGLAMWLLVRSVTPVPFRFVWMCICASALGVTGGFLALFAPGGIGVRELVFLLVLTPEIGPSSAALVTVAMRLTYTLAEVVLAVFSLWLLRGSSRPKALEPEDQTGMPADA